MASEGYRIATDDEEYDGNYQEEEDNYDFPEDNGDGLYDPLDRPRGTVV